MCCEKMVEVNALGVLYRLVNSCNRSLPHMELIKYTVNILLNLAKVIIVSKTSCFLVSETSESMCTNYWLTACSSLPRKKCG